MTVEAHPVDRMLRAATGDPQPSMADLLHGHRALAAAFAAESAPAAQSVAARSVSGGAVWWRWGSLATAALVLVFAVVAVAGVLRPAPVTALGDLAEVAQATDRTFVAAGEYLYSRTSESSFTEYGGSDIGLDDQSVVPYVLPIQREQWIGADGVREIVNVGTPVFLDEAAEAAYFASELPSRDGVGTSVINDYGDIVFPSEDRDWPTDPAALVDAMHAYASGEGADRLSNAAVLDLAGDLLRDPEAPAELRSAIFEALGLMDFEVAVRESDRAVAVRITYDEDILTQLELVFDAESRLVEERVVWLEASAEFGTPAGFVESEIQYSPTVVVGSLETP